MAIVNDTSSGTNNMVLYVSIILFAIISYVLYKFVLSPTQPADTQQRQQQRVAASSTRTIRPSTSTSSTARSSTITTKNNTDNDDYKFGQSRHPSHLLPPSNWSKGSNNREDLSGYLLKGIIPFRSTYANGYEVRLQQEQKMKNEQAGSSEEVKDLVVVNRKERARIFARMFSSTSSATAAKSTAAGPSKPPNRGSNIVMTIHHTDVITNSVDSKLHKILYLLGTYYNVFVLVDASDVEPKIVKDEEVKEYINKIRTQLYTNTANNNSSSNNNNEYQLNKQIVPTHRIIVSTTASGRVAFVRQLADTQLVIDYDKEGVVKELERFGFRTLCYPRVEGGDDKESESSLGKFLIP